MGKQSTFVSTVQKGKKNLRDYGYRGSGSLAEGSSGLAESVSAPPAHLCCQELGICKTLGQPTVREKVVDLSTCSCPDK